MSNDPERPGPLNRFLDQTEEVFETMWPETLSQTVIELFAEHDAVTRAQLIDELERRRDEEGTSRLDKAKLRGALRALRG